MRFLPLFFLIGILLNFGCIVVFRLKLDRKYQNEIAEMSSEFQRQISDFSASALHKIDDYFISNRFSRVCSDSVSSSSPSFSVDDILFKPSGDWDYLYMQINNQPFARVGIVNFTIGSRFPLGGVITAIYPDTVVVNDSLSFRNRSFFSSSLASLPSSSDEIPFVPDTTYKPNKELTDYVRTTHTMRE